MLEISSLLLPYPPRVAAAASIVPESVVDMAEVAAAVVVEACNGTEDKEGGNDPIIPE